VGVEDNLMGRRVLRREGSEKTGQGYGQEKREGVTPDEGRRKVGKRREKFKGQGKKRGKRISPLT